MTSTSVSGVLPLGGPTDDVHCVLAALVLLPALALVLGAATAAFAVPSLLNLMPVGCSFIAARSFARFADSLVDLDLGRGVLDVVVCGGLPHKLSKNSLWLS